MQILKYLFLLLILSFIGLTVYITTQKGDYAVTRSKVVKAPRMIVFEYVNDFSNWNDWQQFNTDENIAYTTSENTIGKKSYVKWDSENVIITTFAQKDSISQLFIQNDNKQTLHWKFKKSFLENPIYSIKSTKYTVD